MKERNRMNPELRREQILKAAVEEAERVGFNRVSRVDIANRAGCSQGLVRHYFATLPQLQRMILGEAIRTDNDRVIAQGVVAKHPRCKKLTAERKFQALESTL